MGIEDLEPEEREKEEEYISVLIPLENKEAEVREKALKHLLLSEKDVDFDSGYYFTTTPTKAEWQLDWSFSAPDDVSREDVLELLDLMGLEYEVDRRVEV